MAGAIQSAAFGTQDTAGARAAAKIPSNTRVKSTLGFVTVQTETMTIPGPLYGTGNWVAANQRVLVMGVPTVGASATGIAVPLSPTTTPPGTLIPIQGETRVTAM